MPYRSLTHGRVRGAQKAPANAHTNQVKAIESQKGVGNSGPIRKNNSNNRQSTTRTLSRNFLMAPNAYGNGRFSPGQGKGFPEATPLPSVGSVNRFARRAIARRAVTKRIGVHGSENCCPDNKKKTPTLNLTQSFTVQATNALQLIGNIPTGLGAVPGGAMNTDGGIIDINQFGVVAEFYNPANVGVNNTEKHIFWAPSYASNSTLGSTDDWGDVDFGTSAKGSFVSIVYDDDVDRYYIAIQVSKPVGLLPGENAYTVGKDFNVKLTVTRASTTASHNAGDVQVILDHKVIADQMQNGAANNQALIGFENNTGPSNNFPTTLNTDNGAFNGAVNINYSDINFANAATRLQLDDVLTISVTSA